MTGPRVIPWSAVHAAFRPRDPVGSLGRAAWLYLALLSAASDKGVVIRTPKHLARVLSITEATLDVWLSRFANAGLIRIKSESRSAYLVILLPFWSDHASGEASNLGKTRSKPVSLQEEVPVYSNSYSSAIALKKNSGVRGQGEGEELTQKLRSVLAGVEAAEIERILARYPQVVIRKTLDRVAKTPPEKIRKSKTALFRYLLAKFSQEIDVRDL